MQSKKWEKLRSRLKKAVADKDDAIRRIKIAAVLSDALKQVDIEPILVGGAAVTFYTDGKYTTQDIDMIASSSKDVDEIMSFLGFEKKGKDFFNKVLKIYIEFPSDSLGPTEKYDVIKVDNSEVRIISIEDLIVDRLAAYKFWKSGIDGVNVLRLLELGVADKVRVEERAREEDVLDALDYVEDVLETSIRKRLSPKEASDMLEKYFHWS